jgi:hypothetical protein
VIRAIQAIGEGTAHSCPAFLVANGNTHPRQDRAMARKKNRSLHGDHMLTMIFLGLLMLAAAVGLLSQMTPHTGVH